MKRILLLIPGTQTIGGMQKRDNLLIKAMDYYLSQEGGFLNVLALNDRANKETKKQNLLKSTRFISFNGNRIMFFLQSVKEFLLADVVFYGLLGFTPLVLIQNLFPRNIKSYLLMHGVEVWEKRKGPYSLAVSTLTGVVSVSTYTLERYLQVYQVPSSQRKFILPNSLGIEEKIEKIPFDKANLGELNLLSVARLSSTERYKGIDTVIEAMPTLLRSFPNLHYTIIGDGTDKERLQQLATDLNVSSSVIFKGYISENELDLEYSNCTIFVLPSAGEGFGIVFLEAMAKGKPVIAARSGGTPEVVKDFETGLLIEYGNVRELEESILRLLRQNELRNKMGNLAIERVNKFYTYTAFRNNTKIILDSILEGI